MLSIGVILADKEQRKMENLVEKTIRIHTQRLTERRVIKRVADAHEFLNKQYDNTWKIHTEGWKPGTYAFAGGKWHNVKSLDPSILAHI